MRHATFNAVAEISGGPGHYLGFVRACDWATAADPANDLSLAMAERLMRNDYARLPDCPQCAVFCDAAFEARPTH